MITQTAPAFRAPYEGPRSFRNEGSSRASTTLTTTLFTGLALWKGAWISVHPEFSGGDGIGGGQGIAAYVNQDAVRTASGNQKPYLARAFLHQDIALGVRDVSAHPKNEEAEPEDAPDEDSRDLPEFLPGGAHGFGLPEGQPHFEITLGKISLADLYDTNDVAGDVHHRLMNWALVNNGAWDYAADARGYTWGATVAYVGNALTLRAGAYAMPREANGLGFDHAFGHAHSENAEAQWTFDPSNAGVVRLLLYVNHARMGNYEQALAAASGSSPDITATRQPGRNKKGLGLNLQRRFGKVWGAFARLGWNDGRTESFTYTEIDRTASFGVSRSGSFLKRPHDTIVAALVVSGLSGWHRRYLEAGGIGFQIGDGRLRYKEEEAVELDYNARVTKRLSLALDAQRVIHPGYNADRGPITVLGLRLHIHR